MNFKIQFTDENLHNNTGLSLISKLIDSVNPANIFKSHGLSIKSRYNQFSDLDIFFACLGIISLGHTSFENIDLFKNDQLFKKALGFNKVPSKESIRQRLDYIALNNTEVIPAFNKWNHSLLMKFAKPDVIKKTELIPVDFDVTVMDNTGSKKEGVEQSYRPKVKGFAPMMTNIGSQGYLLNLQFRKGNAHSNCEGTIEYIIHSLKLAQELCPHQKLLARFDSGNDSDNNIVRISELKNCYFLIKHHLKGKNVDSSKQALIQYVMDNYTSKEVVHGTTVRYFAEQPYMAGMYDENGNFVQKSCRRILSVVELNSDINNGQPLLFPFRSLHMWRTNLPSSKYSAKKVIHLYKDHGTSEQFHSEFKSDLDIERLPSSKFKTNTLFVSIAQIVFNLMRIIGDQAIKLKIINPSKNKIRVRIRTVLLKIIFIPCKLIRKNKIWTINLPRSNPLSFSFSQIYSQF